MDDGLTYIVLVNFRRPDDTIQCLQSLGAMASASFRVVLVDNASGDTSAERLRDWLLGQASEPAENNWFTVRGTATTYPVRLIAHNRNDGFASGCNIGIKLALEDQSCRYVWLLNNDTLVEPTALEALRARAGQDARIAMCGSTLVYVDPARTVQAFGGHFSLTRGRGYGIGAMTDRLSLPETAAVEPAIDYVVGASMLVSCAFIRHVGLMDERYFLFFEELDWALRAKRHGYSLAWARDSIVLHKEGATIGSSTTGRQSDLASFFMTASYLRIVSVRARALLPWALLTVSVRIGKRIASGDLREARTMTRGVLDFLRHPRRHVPGSYTP